MGPDGLWGTGDDVLGDNSGSGHEPWYVTDGSAQDLDGLVNGIIKTTWFVNPDDSFLEKFLLTANGDNGTPSDASDNQKAVTTFTDGQLALWSWRNQPGPTLNTWDAGTTIQKSNSVYGEGDVIPFRWTDLAGKGGGQDLIENQTYTIQLSYAYAGGTTFPGKLFFDYLTSYNATESMAAPFGPGSDLSGFQSASAVAATPILNDGGDIGGSPANPATVPHSAGNLTLYNIVPTSVIFAYAAKPVNSTQEDRLLNITFKVADDGDANPNEAQNVGIAWGGHLAAASDYGIGNGAANFPGASPQMVVDLNPAVSGDSVNININPNAIIPQGQITIFKDAVPLNGTGYSTQDFSYTITGPGGYSKDFVLDDDNGADTTNSNNVTFSGLVEGVYTITEGTVSNWQLSNITASENGALDSTSTDISSPSVVNRNIQITVANGEVWTTTFTNQETVPPKADLAIIKEVSGVYNSDDTVDSDSTVDSAGDYILYKVQITNAGNVPLTNVVVSDPLLGGTIDTLATFAAQDTKTYSDLKYVVKQTDIDTNGGGDGYIDNTASADSTETDKVEDSVQVPVDYAPGLDIAKTVVSVEDTNNNGLTDAGDKINYNIKVSNTGNVTLTGVSVVDPLTGQNIGAETIAVGTSKDFGSSYVITQADVDTNGNNNDGDIDNTATADSDQTGPKDGKAEVKIDYKPGISVEKYVSVDGGNSWYEADSPTGPTMVNTAGINPLFKFEVKNTGNVTLHDVVLVDDGGTPSTTADDTSVSIGTLNVNSSWIYGDDAGEKYELPWKAGQQVNQATVDSKETDLVKDPAYYFGAMSAIVTNSSLCTFGDNFNLIFTPDYSLGSGNYRLSDSNPGQFYYNMFDHGVKGETKTYTFEIPKPFVPQGAVPVHIYDSVHIDTMNGQYCLTPGNELANYKLTDLTQTDTDKDGNIEYTFSATFANDTDLYLNMHLDYGLEKQSGWSKSVDASGNENAVDNTNVAGVQPDILEKTNYQFSASINNVFQNDSVDSIFNDNVFKNLKGVGGFVRTANDHDPIGGQNVILLDSKGSKVGSATTDLDGWEFMTVNAPGKSANYTAFWDQDKNGVKDLTEPYQNITWGGSTKFVEVNFDYADHVVGSNSAIDALLI